MPPIGGFFIRCSVYVYQMSYFWYELAYANIYDIPDDVLAGPCPADWWHEVGAVVAWFPLDQWHLFTCSL